MRDSVVEIIRRSFMVSTILLTKIGFHSKNDVQNPLLI